MAPQLGILAPKKEKHQFDMVQRLAARLCLNDYSRESSVSAMISSLQWTSLETRRKMLRLAMMYKINGNLVDVDWTPLLTRPFRTLKRTHHLAFQRPRTTSTIYSNSFFPWTVTVWNTLPRHILNAPNLNIFKARLCDHFTDTGNTSYGGLSF